MVILKGLGRRLCRGFLYHAFPWISSSFLLPNMVLSDEFPTRLSCSLQASLHATNIRCNELARGLQQATAALDAERANVARLRTERDEHAADLAKARSQAAELQVSGSVALTTSEVCRAALSTAFKGTVSVIGSAHEELESALATQQQQQLELEAYQQRVDELEELALAQVEELEDARIKRRQLSEAMEELAERLQAREDEVGRAATV